MRRTMAIVSDYTIEGHVNSRSVAGHSSGRIDFDSGVSELLPQVPA